MGIGYKAGKFGYCIRTRGEVGVDNGTITIVKVIIGDGSKRKLAGIGTLEWLEWDGIAGIAWWAGIAWSAGILRWELLIIRHGRVE